MLGRVLVLAYTIHWMYVSHPIVVYFILGKRSPAKSQEPEMIQVITKDLIRRLRFVLFLPHAPNFCTVHMRGLYWAYKFI